MSTAQPEAPKRPHRNICDLCARPVSACICALARPATQPVQVLVLQHPMEVKHPKGTARLLHLSLPGSRLVVGEVFEPGQLQSLLFGPWDCAAQRHTVLLYPGGDNRVAAPAQTHWPASIRLVVLDGTWRKSRKMLALNPLLQALPRLALQDLPPRAYRLRKADQPHHLSTLEATWAALRQLHGCSGAEPHPVDGLMQAFEGLMAQQECYFYDSFRAR